MCWLKIPQTYTELHKMRQPLFLRFQIQLANSVNTKCRPSKLIVIHFWKIIIDALGQGTHYFVSFFIINIEQIIV